MEIYAPAPSGTGMLDGRPADGEVGSINPRNKGTNGEEKNKTATTGDLSSGLKRDTAILGEVQLFEMTTNRNNEREHDVVQDANDPASTPSKRKHVSSVWDTDRSSR